MILYLHCKALSWPQTTTLVFRVLFFSQGTHFSLLFSTFSLAPVHAFPLLTNLYSCNLSQCQYLWSLYHTFSSPQISLSLAPWIPRIWQQDSQHSHCQPHLQPGSFSHSHHNSPWNQIILFFSKADNDHLHTLSCPQGSVLSLGHTDMVTWHWSMAR